MPPNLGLSSASITLAPFLAAAYALANPDGPDPAINKSQYSYLCSYLSLSCLIDAIPRPAAFLINGSYTFIPKTFWPHKCFVVKPCWKKYFQKVINCSNVKVYTGPTINTGCF